MPDQEPLLLVYDRECPVCDAYCRLVKVRESAGELKRVDARKPDGVMAEITAAGLDIDQGMVLKMGGTLYYGAEAIHMLARIGTRSGFFNRINYWIFRSRAASKVLYPVLRFFRNLLLKLLRKTRINNLGVAGNDRF